MPFDPNFSSLKLLLHGNGADAGTSITDSSPTAKSITRVGGGNAPTTSTTQSKFGGAALRFGGSGWLTTPYTPETGDFTAEFWVRFDAVTSAANLLGYQNNGSTVRAFQILRDTTTVYAVVGIGASWLGSGNLTTGSGAVSANTWYHFALTRSGSDFKLWKDGVQAGTTYTNAGSLNSSSSTLVVGSRTDAYTLAGYMDEIAMWPRCKYTSTFAVPNSQYHSNSPGKIRSRFSGEMQKQGLRV